MQFKRKSLTLLTSISLFSVVGVCLIPVTASADPATGTGNQKPSSPPASFMDDPLLGSTSLYPFRDAYAYAPDGYPKAHAVLAVPQPFVRQVRQDAVSGSANFAVDICFYNDSGTEQKYYNLGWDSSISQPGRLTLYDAQKRYVCDLLERFAGSSRTSFENDWTDISASGYTGKILSVSFPYPSYKVIPPGKYYLQMIYLQSVVRSPAETNMRGDRADPIGQSELFRSNAVPITVVDQSAVKMSKPAVVPSKP